jgi:hypothetical protein
MGIGVVEVTKRIITDPLQMPLDGRSGFVFGGTPMEGK